MSFQRVISVHSWQRGGAGHGKASCMLSALSLAARRSCSHVDRESHALCPVRSAPDNT